ncbi:MAG: GGDEF domain-containing protein [Actinomycetota bacterium]|nr:GGDEF domain-containing protein [Actinomycetota bacterium]
MSDDTPTVIGSASGPPADDAHLDAAVRWTLPWVAATLAGVTGAAAAVVLTDGGVMSQSVVAGVLLAATGLELVLTVLAVVLRSRLPLPEAWAAAAVLVAATAGVLAVVASDDVVWSALVAVAVAASGVAVVSTRWVIAVLYAVWVGWLAGLAAAELSTQPVLWLAAVGAMTALTVLASYTRGRLLEQLLASEETVDQVAVRDPLTGLVNRRGLSMLGMQIVESARRQGDAVHCVFIDIDQLRHVNEVVSHEAGDDVLVAVGDALRATTRSTDVVARWGGDEFCIIGPGAGMAPMELERRIRERVQQNPPVPEEIWSPRVVAGGAMLAPWDSGSLDALLGKADQEMYLRRALRRGGAGRPRPATPERERPSVDPG